MTLLTLSSCLLLTHCVVRLLVQITTRILPPCLPPARLPARLPARQLPSASSSTVRSLLPLHCPPVVPCFRRGGAVAVILLHALLLVARLPLLGVALLLPLPLLLPLLLPGVVARDTNGRRPRHCR